MHQKLAPLADPLPTANRDRKDWSKESKCKGLPSLFTGDETLANVRAVKAICDSCPVFSECLGYALATGVPGIWAGTNTSQREAMKVNRRILQNSVPVEPELSFYLKEDEPAPKPVKKPQVIQKPKGIEFPSKAPKVSEKKPVHQSQWDILDQTLRELQSSSWLSKL